jgi:hypothetical protein
LPVRGDEDVGQVDVGGGVIGRGSKRILCWLGLHRWETISEAWWWLPPGLRQMPPIKVLPGWRAFDRCRRCPRTRTTYGPLAWSPAGAVKA